MSKFLHSISKIIPIRHMSTRASLIAPSVVNTPESIPPTITQSVTAAHKRKWLPNRCGVVAQKVGMKAYFNKETGERMPCTVLLLDNVEVLLHRTIKENGYTACQVGYGSKNPDKVTRQMLGHFASHNVNPKERVSEFRVRSKSGLLKVGTNILPSFFKVGQFVDLKSVSKGKGFAGVMKRHNFKGQGASHGTSLTHRHGGSYGQNQDPGRVLPGKKMPGRMGGKQVTIQNAKVLEVDDENGVILVKGPVAGPKGSYVKIQDSIKKPFNPADFYN
ncbi:hypothetical protein TBLA_0B07480 [Henningerozyma blattae CBS 6284]|uniref:Large ribosomal subunit protein uL3m n=1 Tax=Henningerozyma blattae (strain ATCC 34711 / CBS 6284 / DSM 70876 / NBRC 10599 / NRRL Y-10934 / UCD 77-7) TaxID=1071380 RepID=I2GZL4_HENB6|nr:hypothetical protein TBLA_0B07480 [Tetrapisispora blattae CBS 6284]CCH59566.1 hypothetical protein TBLA_0B07480 [Tetrapisispora blattae CBS 6284]